MREAALTSSACGSQNSVYSSTGGEMSSSEDTRSRSQKTKRSVVHSKHTPLKNVRYDMARWCRCAAAPNVTLHNLNRMTKARTR